MREAESVAPGVLGQRLAEARKACGKTQEAAADCLGCSRPVVIAIEKGTRPASADEIVKLASFYGRSVHEIMRPSAPQVALAPHLRAVVDQSVKGSQDLSSAIWEMQRLAEDYVELERLMHAQLPENHPPELRGPVPSGAHEMRALAEDVALRERARLSLGDQPILSLRRVLESEVGIRIFCGALPSAVAGMYAFVADLRYCIMLNRKHPPERRRATLAHEYGHFFCDRHKPGIDYLSEGSRKPANERFAEAFAMSLLMPATGVRRQFREIRETTNDFQVADLCRLSNFYFVSVQAMTLRLEALGLILEGSWRLLAENRFQAAAAKRGLNLSAQSSESNDPYPERYKFLAVQAFQHALISEGELAVFLRCDRVTAREIVRDCLNCSDVDEGGNEAMVSMRFEDSLLRSKS